LQKLPFSAFQRELRTDGGSGAAETLTGTVILNTNIVHLHASMMHCFKLTNHTDMVITLLCISLNIYKTTSLK